MSVSVMQWEVENFKALKQASLDVANLNLLVGSNSSGKSSLIQSILFAAQSLNSNEISLNGPLVTLGRASDVIHQGQNRVSIGARLKVGTSVGAHRRRPRETENSDFLGLMETSPTGEAGISYEFDSVDNTELSLRDLTIRWDSNVVFKASKTNINATDANTIREQYGNRQVQILHLKTSGHSMTMPRTYLVLDGIRPLDIVRHVDDNVARKSVKSLFPWQRVKEDAGTVDTLARSLRMLSPGFLDGELGTRSRRTSKSDRTQREKVVNELIDHSRLMGGPMSTARIPKSQYEEAIEYLTQVVAAEKWVKYPISYLEDIRYLSYRQDDLEYMFWRYKLPLLNEELDPLAILAAVSQELNGWLRNVRYIGPLRDQPRVVSTSYTADNRLLPVGPRGEYASHLLYGRGSRPINYIDPEGGKKRSPLSLAVSEWAAYLGIADKIDARDQGKLGRGIEVSLNSATRDLTAVGVGASQLIPIVISLLSAENGALFVCEQPELHLHPAVQARLADFFLTARPEVRIIVETHSEYLVTRVRRRVAEGKQASSGVRVYFVSQHAGVSVFESIDMDDYGNLSHWPAGFFDEQEKDLNVIISKGMERRLAAGRSKKR